MNIVPMVVNTVDFNPCLENVDVYFKPNDNSMWVKGYNPEGKRLFAVKVENVGDDELNQFINILNRMCLLDSYYVD